MFNEKQFSGMWDNARCGLSKSNEESTKYVRSDDKRLTERELKKLEKEAKKDYYNSQFNDMFGNIFDKISRW